MAGGGGKGCMERNRVFQLPQVPGAHGGACISHVPPTPNQQSTRRCPNVARRLRQRGGSPFRPRQHCFSEKGGGPDSGRCSRPARGASPSEPTPPLDLPHHGVARTQANCNILLHGCTFVGKQWVTYIHASLHNQTNFVNLENPHLLG